MLPTHDATSSIESGPLTSVYRPRSRGRAGPKQSPEACAYLPRVIVPLATVEVARAHAAALESASRSRKGRDRSNRASQPAPFRRGRPAARAEPSSRTGIPLLRSPVGSKGGEVLELALLQSRPSAAAPLWGDRRNGWRPPSSGDGGNMKASLEASHSSRLASARLQAPGLGQAGNWQDCGRSFAWTRRTSLTR